MIFPPGEAGLFNLNFGTCLFEDRLQLLSFGLGQNQQWSIAVYKYCRI